MEDYMSFEEVMGELNLDSDELREMVSEGKLRAFKSDDRRMKFKKEDVTDLARSSGNDPEIVLPEDEEGQTADQASGQQEISGDSGGAEDEGYLSFQEVMGELEVQSDELRQMVSSGKLPAFKSKSEGEMKFQRDDVQSLAESGTEETAPEQAEEEVADVGEVDDMDLEEDLESEEPMEFDDLEEDLEDVSETVVEDESEEDLDLENLDFEDDEFDLDDDLEMDEEPEVEEEPSGATEEMIFEDDDLTAVEDDFEGSETMGGEQTISEDTLMEDDLEGDATIEEAPEIQEDDTPTEATEAIGEPEELTEEPAPAGEAATQASPQAAAGQAGGQTGGQPGAKARKKAYARRGARKKTSEGFLWPVLIFVGVVLTSLTIFVKVDEARTVGVISNNSPAESEVPINQTWGLTKSIAGFLNGMLVNSSQEGADLKPGTNKPVGEFPEDAKDEE